jgi:O-methyltransferase/methyltransferase family protein
MSANNTKRQDPSGGSSAPRWTNGPTAQPAATGHGPDVGRIMELAHAFRASKTLLSAVELGVFTILADGPLDITTLSGRVGLHKRGARDFLDVLVALRLLVRGDDGRYANSADADCFLDRRKDRYVGSLLERLGSRDYAVWGSLTAALRSGKPQYDQSVVNNFAPMYEDVAARELYVRGMTVRTRSLAQALAAQFPWNEHCTLIDIGTAQGCLPVEIALAHNHIGGGGFDLPQLGATFDEYVQKHALSNRLRFYPGNFLEESLPRADVLVLGRVLHNWDLATKKMLLQKAYAALPSGGRLIVYERLIDDERRSNAAGLLSSLQMLLASNGGFDFTGADCVSWMREAGFCELRIVPLVDHQSMVIGQK